MAKNENPALEGVRNFLNLPQKKSEKEKLLDSISQARRDWQMAEARFNYAVDKEMIDYAIYDAMAARKRYMYLMSLAQQPPQDG